MKRNLFFLGLMAIALLFTSCEQERIEVDASVYVVEIPDGYMLITSEIVARITPTPLLVGEELSINVTHKEEKELSVKISSESLGFQERLTTPGEFTHRIATAGVHDLTITYKYGSVTKNIVSEIVAIPN
uniref:hypothetical protein n=1 Tax=Alistipes sp. TaxID=1872444 RepID=UPI00405729F7